MALAPQDTPAKLKTTFGFDADKALSTPLGLASPLWLAFGAAASAGVAYWWFTRWLRPTNLEAAPEMVVATVAIEPQPAPVVEVEPEVAAEAAAETAPETTTPAVVEPEPVALEPIAQAAPEAEPKTTAASAPPRTLVAAKAAPKTPAGKAPATRKPAPKA